MRTPLAPTPLFTRDELAAAFAFLLPTAKADELATRWWDEFADAVDATGCFVHHDTWGIPRPVDEHEAAPQNKPEWHLPEIIATDEALFRNWSDEEAERWLLRLGDLHLALVALVNDDLFERMRRVRYLSRAAAERNRLQLTRAVRAYRSARKWPPAV